MAEFALGTLGRNEMGTNFYASRSQTPCTILSAIRSSWPTPSR
jgi:hypothetical protein